MLLRASSKATEKSISLSCAIGEQITTDIENGELLLKFTEAANSHASEIEDLTDEIIANMGVSAFIKAASIVSIFNGLVRSADAIGIPLDEITMSSTIEEREALGINNYPGFNNSSERDN